ncbi:MAG: matrixin family metalloprotease [Pirellulaceae bacterium]
MSSFKRRRHRVLRVHRILAGIMLSSWVVAATGRADVIVLANRTRDTVACQVVRDQTRSQALQIPAGDLTVLTLRGSCELTYGTGSPPTHFELDANSVYLFVRDAQGGVDVNKIDLGGNSETFGGRALGNRAPAEAIGEIPIKVLVDNYELTRPEIWEKRLRERIDRVSDILERCCRLRLKIVEVAQWTADSSAADFQQALLQFRRSVEPHPGRLAIGFTGRYSQPQRVLHLGGTQGMLQSHILVREWSASMSEPERDEVLLHEVGHYLGAVHSPDPVSVMRPMLADNQAIRTRFRIGFDPVNTLIINLIAEEIRERSVSSLADMTPGTRLRLGQIYSKLADAVPQDNSARQLQFQLGMVGDTPLAAATRHIVDAVRTAAQERAAGAVRATPVLEKDSLTEYYVRRAAAAAQTLPADVAPAAFILGLGVALDDSATLLQNPLTRGFSEALETPPQRVTRCRMLANPTLLDRRDLLLHFFLSGYLTAVVGSTAAESAGIAKELADAKPGGSGFSYIDLTADLAGIHFAERVLQRDLSLEDLATGFSVAAYLPSMEGLPEGLPWEELTSAETAREGLAEYRRDILDRLARLRDSGQAPAETPE